MGYCPWGRKRVRHDLATKKTNKNPSESATLYIVNYKVFILADGNTKYS